VITAEEREALELARHLAENGVPLFLADPDPQSRTGFRLPKGWQFTAADPTVVDRWRPGQGLCAVMGHAVDAVDVDPRNGGHASHVPMPHAYGRASTPSGGEHYLVSSLGVRTLDGVVPGVDVKAGVDGEGHGFIFIAPTRRKGGTYRWVEEPDLSPLLIGDDDSGAPLARLIRARREKASPQPENAALPVSKDYVRRTRAGVKSDLENLGSMILGDRNARGHGWDAGTFAAACQLRRASNSSGGEYPLEQARADFFDHAPTDANFTAADLEHKWNDAERLVGGAGLTPNGSPEDDFDAWDEEDEAKPTTPRPDVFDRQVEREAQRLRVVEAARALVARERRDPQPLPTPMPLSDFLAEPDEETAYRVEGLWPTAGRVVLSAQNKAGKTTLIGNLMRSLADGEPFLDHYVVKPADRVLLVDDEMSPGTIRRWLRDQSIGNTRAIDVVSLRGRLSTFNLLDPVIRSEWATALGAADVLIFDCLRPVLDALGLSEDKEAGRFLEALDELICEAGIGELVVVHHMGHSNERSRGDSRILDWPDAIWKLLREDPDDPMSERFFSAYGRDVEQPEVRLAFNTADRHLVVNGGSRRDARAHRFEDDVLDFVQNNPGCSQSAIEKEVTGDTNAIRRAIKQLEAAHDLRVEHQGQTKRHFVDADTGDQNSTTLDRAGTDQTGPET
jgi:hypothetical protein